LSCSWAPVSSSSPKYEQSVRSFSRHISQHFCSQVGSQHLQSHEPSLYALQVP
jgi:hypothetical protein